MSATLADLGVELAACDYCSAPRGTPCQVARGRTVGARAAYVHAARLRLAYAAWGDGYEDGLREALAWIGEARRNGHTLAQVEARLNAYLR